MLKLTIHQYQLNLAESWSRWRLGIWCSIFTKWSTLCFQQHQPWAFCPQDASPRSNIAAGMQWHQILWPDKGNGWKWCFFKGELFQNAWTFCFMMNTAGWFSFTQSVVVRVEHINIGSQDCWSLCIFVLSMNLCMWLYEYWIDSSDLHTNSKHLATSRTVCFEHNLTSYFFVCDLNIETKTNHNKLNADFLVSTTLVFDKVKVQVVKAGGHGGTPGWHGCCRLVCIPECWPWRLLLSSLDVAITPWKINMEPENHLFEKE